MGINDDLDHIEDQCDRIVDRVASGSLDPEGVKQALQNIIDGKLPSIVHKTPPRWWRSTDQQLARARELWPGMELPDPPRVFEARTSTEVLLLHVPDIFSGFWWKIALPQGYTKHFMENVTEADERLRGQSRIYLHPVWLAFDPENGRGEPPRDVYLRSRRDRLAASEVLSAVIQFPDWCLSWPEGDAAPCLSGNWLPNDDGLPDVLYLDLWESDKKLYLVAGKATDSHEDWASPSIRALNSSI